MSRTYDEAGREAFRSKVRVLTEDDFQTAAVVRTEKEKKHEDQKRRMARDRRDEQDSRVLEHAPWVYDGTEEEYSIIFHPDFIRDKTHRSPPHLKMDYKFWKLTAHCELRQYIHGKRPKSLDRTTSCCFDCSAGDGDFPCDRCKIKAASSQKRQTHCRRPAPDGQGVLIWTFERPVPSPPMYDPRDDPQLALVPGAVVGTRSSKFAPQTVKPQFATSNVLQPLALGPGDIMAMIEDSGPITALFSILDYSDVARIEEAGQMFQIFHHYDDGFYTLAMLYQEADGLKYVLFDPGLDDEIESPANMRRKHQVQQSMAKHWPKAELTEAPRLLSYYMDVDNDSPEAQECSFLATVSFIALQMWGYDVCDRLSSPVTAVLLDAALHANNIETSNKLFHTSAALESSVIHQRNVVDNRDRLEMFERLLRDTKRVIQLLNRPYEESQRTLEMTGKHNAVSAQAHL